MANYVDPKKFSDAMCEYYELAKEAEAQGEPKPKMSNYIGSCFLEIARHRAREARFRNYPYIEEMIGDAVLNCVQNNNFDPNKSKNAFAYFSQFVWFAFIRRISDEKEELYTKLKVSVDAPAYDDEHPEAGLQMEGYSAEYANDFIQKFEKSRNMN